jgi:hypothetical protein
LAISNSLKNVEINGRQLHYVEQGEDSEQPVIIFVHGSLDDYRCWQFQLDYFSEKYRTISYSRRFAYPNKWIGNHTPQVVKDKKELRERLEKRGFNRMTIDPYLSSSSLPESLGLSIRQQERINEEKMERLHNEVLDRLGPDIDEKYRKGEITKEERDYEYSALALSGPAAMEEIEEEEKEEKEAAARVAEYNEQDDAIDEEELD